MAETTITNLPNAAALTGAERVPMDQGGTTVDATTAAIAATLPDATTSTAGKLSAADKTRLDQLGADDSPTFAGLTITGTDPVIIPHLHADVAGTLYFHVKNTSGGTLTKGAPVSVVGAVGDTTTLEVVATNPGVAGRTHAHGLLYSELANNEFGHAVVLGELQGMNTAALASSSELWVGAAGGTTGTRPATAAQQVATVGRQHATTGTLLISIEGVEPTPAQIGAAPAAQGVTNGNSHNHDGGDGAQIAYSSLSGTPTLGGAAALNVGTTAGTVAAGDVVAAMSARLDQFRDAVGPFSRNGGISTVGVQLQEVSNDVNLLASTGVSDGNTAPTQLAVRSYTDNRFLAGLTVVSGSGLTITDTSTQDEAGLWTRTRSINNTGGPSTVVIPLTGEAVLLGVITLITIPYWPDARILSALPIWMLNTAPTGSFAQFDIRVGGTSIFATLPTIDATETSTATAAVPAVFSTAFIAANQIIGLGANVTFHCTQIGSTVAGAGAKVALPGRRAS